MTRSTGKYRHNVSDARKQLIEFIDALRVVLHLEPLYRKRQMMPSATRHFGEIELEARTSMERKDQ